jgi:hypothetical protein
MLKPRLKERNMHEEDGQVCDVTSLRPDHMAGEDNMAEHSFMMEH